MTIDQNQDLKQMVLEQARRIDALADELQSLRELISQSIEGTTPLVDELARVMDFEEMKFKIARTPSRAFRNGSE